MKSKTEMEKDLRQTLDRAGIPYEVLPCDPDFADTAAFCERYGVPRENSGNTILVATKKEPKRFALCVVLASTRLDVNHAVRGLMEGLKVSFASAEDTGRITGMELGGVTPFNLPDDLPVFVDQEVMRADYIVLGGGGRSSKIKISPEIFRSIPNIKIVPGLSLKNSG
ncbi:MAG: YbaK/EbsC family protein [Acidobacteriota bacterium]